MRANWYASSHATCWMASTSTGSRNIDFPTEKLAKEYVDFKNATEPAVTDAELNYLKAQAQSLRVVRQILQPIIDWYQSIDDDSLRYDETIDQLTQLSRGDAARLIAELA